MSNVQEFSACPKCGTKIASRATHCPACGYEFATGREDVGPISFAFPAVKNAYEPSGKGGAKAILIMFAIGLLVAIIGGALLYPVHNVIKGMARAMPSIRWQILSGIGFHLLTAGLLGYVIALAVNKGVLTGKSRSAKATRMVGLISGLVSCGTYLAIYSGIYGEDLNVIRIVDFLVVIGAALGWSWNVVGETPFCESCRQWMKKFTFAKESSVIPFGTIPIRDESTLMENLNSRRFENIVGLISSQAVAGKDYCTVTVWYCDDCKEQGFINAKTTQTRYKHSGDETKTEAQETRLIFSSPLKATEIDTLVGHLTTN